MLPDTGKDPWFRYREEVRHSGGVAPPRGYPPLIYLLRKPVLLPNIFWGLSGMYPESSFPRRENIFQKHAK
jgi:hypothetical protein